MGSKAVGEPPLLLAAAALMALQRAAQAAREGAERVMKLGGRAGSTPSAPPPAPFVPLLAPATVQAVREACGGWSAAELVRVSVGGGREGEGVAGLEEALHQSRVHLSCHCGYARKHREHRAARPCLARGTPSAPAGELRTWLSTVRVPWWLPARRPRMCYGDKGHAWAQIWYAPTQAPYRRKICEADVQATTKARAPCSAKYAAHLLAPTECHVPTL